MILILSQPHLYSYIHAVECPMLYMGNLQVCFMDECHTFAWAVFVPQSNGSIQTSL